jgi:hypothetical protein
MNKVSPVRRNVGFLKLRIRHLKLKVDESVPIATRHTMSRRGEEDQKPCIFGSSEKQGCLEIRILHFLQVNWFWEKKLIPPLESELHFGRSCGNSKTNTRRALPWTCATCSTRISRPGESNKSYPFNERHVQKFVKCPKMLIVSKIAST